MTKEKRGRGRPAHVPTAKDRENVELMAALGIRHDYVARIIGVCEHVLRDNYRDELDIGKAKVDVMVGGNLVRQAVKDDVKAASFAIFYAKTQMGWREVTRFENTGAYAGCNRARHYRQSNARIAENGR